MRCPACGGQASSGSLFCPHCGGKLLIQDGIANEPPRYQAAELGNRPIAETLSVRTPLGRRPAADVPEEILWQGSYSPKAMLGRLIACAVVSFVLLGTGGWLGGKQPFIAMLLLAIMLGMWVLLAANLMAKRLGIHYKLTNQMFYHQRGILTRVTDRIEVIDIDDVTFRQSLLNRMVGVGDIKVSSSDQTDPNFWINGIEKVEDVARMIDKARRAERIRRGVSVESLSPHSVPDGGT